MNPLVEEVIRLTKKSLALTDDQRTEIIEAAPQMTEQELKDMKVHIFKLSKSHLNLVEAESAAIKAIADKYRKDKRRNEEEKSHAAEEAEAEELLSNL